jgi:glucokinase
MRAIGVDLGGTKMSFGVINSDGELIDPHRIPTASTWGEMKTSIIDQVRRYQNDYDDIGVVGFGAAGMVDLNGYVHYSPNVPAFDNGVGAQQELRDELGMDVFVDNDNNCAGYAEATFGDGAKKAHTIFVGLGTGIGGAIIINGKVIRGEHGYAGDVGHFTMDPNGPLCACGRTGCFEAFASGSALGRLARDYAKRGDAPNIVSAVGNIDNIVGLDAGKAAAQGLSDGIAIVDEYSRYVATGLVSLVNIFDPGKIIIGGGVVELGDTLFVPLRMHLQEYAQAGYNFDDDFVVPAKLGEHAGVIGAGAWALSQV